MALAVLVSVSPHFLCRLVIWETGIILIFLLSPMKWEFFMEEGNAIACIEPGDVPDLFAIPFVGRGVMSQIAVLSAAARSDTFDNEPCCSPEFVIYYASFQCGEP